jgi:hypothetical protein
MAETCSLAINVFDGRRRLLAPKRDVFYRVIDGTQEVRFRDIVRASSLTVDSLPFYDNFGDNYLVLVSADQYHDAGFTPVIVSPDATTVLDLMLIPKKLAFNFAGAGWNAIKARLPFLASDVSDAAGRARYKQLLDGKPRSAAALFNITTVMEQVFLPHGRPIDYIKHIEWDDSLAQDRFFAYCDKALLDEVRLAADHGEFAAEPGSGFFHPGATASWKQVQFGEANLQLTFHEGDTQTIDGVECIGLEPDIDYHKDLLAHALFEVIPNSLFGGLTNPETVYVLRWIAGRHAGVPEFNPPFTIEPV